MCIFREASELFSDLSEKILTCQKKSDLSVEFE